MRRYKPDMQFQIPDHQKTIAVGLSGGGDSMALTHMLCHWAVEQGRQIHALTVDHGLRAESAGEAQQVAAWIKDFPNCTHDILQWDHDEKPDTGVMEKARQARYALMKAYCDHHDIETLCLAHHADDQIETFFFRLAKGSGLDGLTGMKAWGGYDGLAVYRPLLNHSHENLIQYCRDNNLQWIEDPSNHDARYARPRLRKSLREEGFDQKRFAKTLERLSRAQEALDAVAVAALSSQRKLGSKATLQEIPGQARDDNAMGDIFLNFQSLATHPLDIQIRVVQKALMQVGETTTAYPPKLERIEDILEALKPGQSATLYNCLLTLSKDGAELIIQKTEKPGS